MNAQDMAKLLISLKCLALSPKDPFTYASGLKGPMYCDNRQLWAYPKERNLVVDVLASKVKSLNLEFDAIAGLATGGIPHGMLLADRLNVPFIYVRAKAKGHGKGNQVEGAYKEGQKILMVEDLVNQGKSLGEAMDGVLDAGLKASACLVLVDYQMPAAIEVLKKYSLDLISLTNFDEILGAANSDNILNEEEIQLLRDWHRDPVRWQAPS